MRQRFMRRFVGLDKYSRTVAWAIIGGYVAQIVAAGVLGHFVIQTGLSFGTVSISLILGLFIATRMRGLNNIVHECSHATFTQNRHDNTVMGSVCASLVLGCFKEYRDEHLSHHAHLGDYDHDMDLAGIKDLRIHEELDMRTLMRHLINPFLGRHLPYYMGLNLSRRDGKRYRLLKMSLVIGSGVVLAYAPATAILFIGIPFCFFYPTINYWTDCLDHAGLVAADDELDSSRNVLAPKLVRMLFFPRNDCFHLVHHLFPQVPARHLEDTHKVLAEDPIYQEKQHAIRPAHKSIGKAVAEAA